MSEVAWYFTGIATPFAIVAILAASLRVWDRAMKALARRGITIDFTRSRSNGGWPSDYALRHAIWWERQRGPIFTGLWYREGPEAQGDRLATRWVGIGRGRSGPNLAILHKRNLGPLPKSQTTTPERDEVSTHGVLES